MSRRTDIQNEIKRLQDELDNLPYDEFKILERFEREGKAQSTWFTYATLKHNDMVGVDNRFTLITRLQNSTLDPKIIISNDHAVALARWILSHA